MEDGRPEFKYVIGSSKPIESPENRFCITLNNQRNKKPSSKIDWNNFAHQIYDYHFVVFMMQILLAIELTNKGELGKKGEIMEEEGGFRAERWLT